MDFTRKRDRGFLPIRANGDSQERVNSFRYLGVNITEDLPWTTQTDTPKARQRFYHLKHLRDFRVPPTL